MKAKPVAYFRHLEWYLWAWRIGNAAVWGYLFGLLLELAGGR
jgi:uncharacterized membrane protein YedE/YeeE